MSTYIVLTDDQKRSLATASLPSKGIIAGVNSVIIVRRNLTRKICIVVNDSANIVYLALGPIAAVNQGIRLNANGGSFAFGEFTDFPYFGEISAIASAANSNVSLSEM